MATSLGRRFLPRRLHYKLQFEREPAERFVRRELAPLLGPGRVVLDAGSGSLPEQHFREMIRGSGAVGHACDIVWQTGMEFRADIQRIPVRSATYDVVVCVYALEHVKHPQAVCREFFRVLKPGGHLILTIPQQQELHEVPHHFFNFTRYGLQLIMEEAGFEVVALEPQGGHFRMLGRQLHMTSSFLRGAMTTTRSKVLLYPLLIGSRVAFGLVTKAICLWLDRFDPDPINAFGWSIHCRKPGPAGAGAAQDGADQRTIAAAQE